MASNFERARGFDGETLRWSVNPSALALEACVDHDEADWSCALVLDTGQDAACYSDPDASSPYLESLKTRRALRRMDVGYDDVVPRGVAEDLDRRLRALENTEAAVGERLDDAIRRHVTLIEGVDAIFRTPVVGHDVSIYVIAREHGVVDRELLFAAEDLISGEFAGMTCSISVRAHQGRPFQTAAPGCRLVHQRERLQNPL